MLRPVKTKGPFFDRELETCLPEKLLEIQWTKLKPLIRGVYASNPFYRKKWRSAGLEDPRSIRNLDDFKKLPFTTKKEVAEDQLRNPPFGTNISVPLDRFCRIHETSGTTGQPIKWLDTVESWDWWLRCWAYVYRGAGVGPGDRVFFAFSFYPFIGFWSAFEGARLVGALAIPGGGMDGLMRLYSIFDKKASVLVCTPSYAMSLAGIAAENGIINLPDCGVQKIIAAGEPGASIASVKGRIEELWGARCYDHVGMTEVGAIGFECMANPLGVHLIETEFVFEVVDPDTGAEVPPGAEGELVATSLGRFGMPAFRYRTGDRVKLVRDECPCGRSFARLEGGIIGRVDDLIVVNGMKVFPSALENVIREFHQVKEFLIEVNERGPTRLRVLLEFDYSCYSPESIQATVRSLTLEINRRLSVEVEVEPCPAGSLPGHELKGNRCVRRI